MKNSNQRNLILDIVNNSCNHPTAVMVYEMARNKMPNISLGTVYRNLNLLANMGEIRKISIHEGHDRFDKTVYHHHHLVCIKCGMTHDIMLDVKFDLCTVIENETGHKILDDDLVFKGICVKCQKED